MHSVPQLPRWRGWLRLGLMLAAVVLVLVAACFSSPALSSAPVSPAAPPSVNAFSMTFTSKNGDQVLGITTIPAKPKRIVSIDASGKLTDVTLYLHENLSYLQSQPLWSTLPAVRAGHVFLVPGYWVQGGPYAFFKTIRDIPITLTGLEG